MLCYVMCKMDIYFDDLPTSTGSHFLVYQSTLYSMKCRVLGPDRIELIEWQTQVLLARMLTFSCREDTNHCGLRSLQVLWYVIEKL
jgi:hypothetical protein